MEAYFGVKMSTVRADFKLYTEGLLDEAEWQARKEHLTHMSHSPVNRQ